MQMRWGVERNRIIGEEQRDNFFILYVFHIDLKNFTGNRKGEEEEEKYKRRERMNRGLGREGRDVQFV